MSAARYDPLTFCNEIARTTFFFLYSEMTLAQEIEYLRKQIYLNQKQYARFIEASDERGMQDIAQQNRALIDRLNSLSARNATDRPFDQGEAERIS